MAKDVLKGRLFGSEIYTEAGTNVLLHKSAILLSDTEGLYFSPAASGATVAVEGRIVVENVGIYAEGASSRISVARTGLISGELAIALSGDDGTISSKGTLIGLGDCVWIGGDRSKFVNTGDIWGEDGVVLVGEETTFVNQKSGDVSSIDHAIEIDTFTANTTTRTVNKGLMAGGDGTVFWGGISHDTLINTGKLIGNIVRLDAGDDVFDNTGGKFTGSAIGGAGDDMLITDRSAIQLVEVSGEGDDTVKSSATYTLGVEIETLILSGKKDIDGTGNASANVMTGNLGDNELLGLAGADTLDGGRGNDSLTGGDDADIFIFATRYGVDKITDFLGGTDKIDLSGFDAIADFTDLTDNHARDRNGNVEIRSGDDKLVITGTTVLDLEVGDFLFT